MDLDIVDQENIIAPDPIFIDKNPPILENILICYYPWLKNILTYFD